MAASRICRPARANRRETHRDVAHRRSGVRARRRPLPIPPAATHRYRAPDATRLLFLRAAARMPHEPMPPEPIDGRRAATEPTDDQACARRPYRPPPRTVTSPPTRPAFCSSELPHEEHRGGHGGAVARLLRARRRQARRAAPDGARGAGCGRRCSSSSSPSSGRCSSSTRSCTTGCTWACCTRSVRPREAGGGGGRGERRWRGARRRRGRPELTLAALFLARAPATVPRMAASRMPPRPSRSTGDAPRRSPPTIRRCAHAAHHTARRLAPSPRPRRDPPFCSSELPHECLTCPCRPSQSRGDAPRRSPPTIRRAHAAHTARRHAPSPRPRRDPHVRPRQDETTHGGGAPDEPPPHARPSDRRADAPVHSAAPVAAPRPCSAPVCRRSAERR
jgi:hypothetical protein